MKLTLDKLQVKSFVTKKETQNLRAGAARGDVIVNSMPDCSPACGPTFFKTCE